MIISTQDQQAAIACYALSLGIAEVAPWPIRHIIHEHLPAADDAGRMLAALGVDLPTFEGYVAMVATVASRGWSAILRDQAPIAPQSKAPWRGPWYAWRDADVETDTHKALIQCLLAGRSLLLLPRELWEDMIDARALRSFVLGGTGRMAGELLVSVALLGDLKPQLLQRLQGHVALSWGIELSRLGIGKGGHND